MGWKKVLGISLWKWLKNTHPGAHGHKPGVAERRESEEESQRWDSTGGAAATLRPHKHAAAPGRARASVKDILEVSCGCNELLGSAPRHSCDHLLSSILGQPAPETGDSQNPLASTSHGHGSPTGWADWVSWASYPREKVVIPSTEMVWDPIRSTSIGRKGCWVTWREFNWKILRLSILKGKGVNLLVG
ncbi:hypothetical protein DBR06_SOUSAS13710028 [Sousa chinensis]|nr:hypothetical protein DBR06_SOUSAS13710028 [Sousa chinensis]